MTKNLNHPIHLFLAEVEQGNALPSFSSHTENKNPLQGLFSGHDFYIFVLFLGDFV